MEFKKLSNLKVSILIPVIVINDYIRESLSYLAKLDYPDFEVLILPDKIEEEEKKEFSKYPWVKIIPTLNSSPSYKRDIGAKEAQGDILAFLDDDAYPRFDWLKNGLRHFGHPDVGAVAGPAVTPLNDPFLSLVSGAVYNTPLVSWKYAYRYMPRKKFWGVKKTQNCSLCLNYNSCLVKDETFNVEDYPSVNFLIRKDLFLKIGGFNTHFWPGEDTKLCLEIINSGKTIVYDPHALVWHHRRPSVKKHLKQVWNYSMHRGYFVKKFPKTSLLLSYFIPSFFLFFLFFGLLISFFNKTFLIFYFFILLVYFFSLLTVGIIEGRRFQKFLIGLLVIPLVFFTHLAYGLGFIAGLIKKELKQ